MDFTQTTQHSLPFAGVLHPAAKKTRNEIVLVVPFYGAERHQLKRHIQFLNDQGFDCVDFELDDDIRKFYKAFSRTDGRFGFKEIWTDQIERMLNELPGRKIVFAFSNPSASAIEAIARRHGSDINGLIIDSGPSGDLFESLINFYKHETKIPFYPLRVAAAFGTTLVWHPQYRTIMAADLAKFPSSLKVLSIRGWKDKLITPKMIDEIFEGHKQIDWQKLSLPQAGHLNGLKDFPEEYVPKVAEFLKSISTPVHHQVTD